jgi:hypothetical protein
MEGVIPALDAALRRRPNALSPTLSKNSNEPVFAPEAKDRLSLDDLGGAREGQTPSGFSHIPAKPAQHKNPKPNLGPSDNRSQLRKLKWIESRLERFSLRPIRSTLERYPIRLYRNGVTSNLRPPTDLKFPTDSCRWDTALEERAHDEFGNRKRFCPSSSCSSLPRLCENSERLQRPALVPIRRHSVEIRWPPG